MSEPQRTYDHLPWGEVRDDEFVRERARITAEMLPSASGRFLDLGCGDGGATSELRETGQIVGLDYNAAALQHNPGITVRGNCSVLPFPRGCFETVVCGELLEHLPQKVYERTLQEIVRVSSRFIIVSVPFAEDLLIGQVRCPECGAEFHVDGHERSFRRDDMNRLLPGWRMRRFAMCGSLQARTPRFAMWLKERLGTERFPADATPCPRCTYGGPYPKTPNLVDRLASQLRKYFGKRRPYWMVCLYEREEERK